MALHPSNAKRLQKDE